MSCPICLENFFPTEIDWNISELLYLPFRNEAWKVWSLIKMENVCLIRKESLAKLMKLFFELNTKFLWIHKKGVITESTEMNEQ